MDIFQKIAKEQPLDFRVFQNKKTHIPSEQSEQKEIKHTNQEPELQDEQVAVKEEPKDVSGDAKYMEKGAISNQGERADKNAIAEEPKQEENQNKIHPEKQEEAVVISFPTPKNKNEEAVLKLEVQLETQKSYMLPVFPIVRYLKNKCLADADFASKVNDEKKTLEKCFRFVAEEVRKALCGSNGWLDDNEVYALAETYFLTDEAVFEKMEQERKEAEKRRQEEVAKKRKEQEEKRKAAIKKSKKKSEEKKEPVAATIETAQADEPEKPMQEQLSLI